MKNYIKPYYYEEIKAVSEKILKEKGDFLFSVVADTHLDNSLDVSRSNIKEVDKIVNFRCLVHLGDFLNGNIPPKYTHEILNNEMKEFQKCLGNRMFIPVQGNHDGYNDIINGGNDIALDSDWHKATSFVDTYSNTSRNGDNPYYYIDFPKEKIRMIVLCSFYYELSDKGKFVKKYGVCDEQIKWLREDALNLQSGWTVMLFSHDFAFGVFSDDEINEKNTRINGKQLIDLLNEMKKKNDFDIAAWFVGHFHGDINAEVMGINTVLVASETAYVPQLFSQPMEIYPDRVLNTVSEDLWDSVILNKKERTLRLVRFGAGRDRIVKY